MDTSAMLYMCPWVIYIQDFKNSFAQAPQVVLPEGVTKAAEPMFYFKTAVFPAPKVFTYPSLSNNCEDRRKDRTRQTRMDVGRGGGFDFQCVQMAEQNRRAGKLRGWDWETGQRSQLIRDHSQCKKTNEQAFWGEKNKKTHTICVTEAGPRFDSSKSSSYLKHLLALSWKNNHRLSIGERY